MLGKIFGIICLISFAFGISTGKGADLSLAVIDGADTAVSLTVSLCGAMALWCGIMKVLERAGLTRALSKMLMPLIKVFFPAAAKSGEGIEEISSNIAANMLGLGNAATPFALSAMKKLQAQNTTPERASPDMITLAVLNTAPPNLLPTTIISLLRAAGASEPYAVILPIWIASFSCAALALFMTRALSPALKLKKRTARRGASAESSSPSRFSVPSEKTSV